MKAEETNWNPNNSQMNLNPSQRAFNLQCQQSIQKIPPNKTNSVLLMEQQDLPCCYLPVYFRIIVQQFKQLQLDSHEATIKLTMLITIKYDGLMEQWRRSLVEYILTKGLDITPYQGDIINVSKCLSNDEDIGQITIYHTQQCICKIFPDLFWSPFQLLYTYTYFQFSSFQVYTQDTAVKFRINLMDHKNTNQKIRPGPNVWIKDYDLAQNLLWIEYNNKPFDQTIMNNKFDFSKSKKNLSKDKDEGYKPIEDSDQEKQEETQNKQLIRNGKNQRNNIEQPEIIQEQSIKKYMIQRANNQKNVSTKARNIDLFHSTVFLDKPNNFRYANICIGIYKIPNSAFSNIFLPFLCLGVINLGIFFQDSSLADRIAAIATIMMAYVASLPTIRAEMPRLPKSYMFIEYLISIQIFTTILCLIQSFTIRQEGQDFVASWDNGWFLSTAILTGFNIICIIILYTLHFCYWMRIYGDYSSKFKDNVNQFDSNEWESQECEQTFSNQIEFEKTIPLARKGKQMIQLLNKLNCLSENFSKFHPNLRQIERNGKKVIVQQSVTINKENFIKWKKEIQNKIFWKKKYLFLPKDIETRKGWCFSQNIGVDLYYSYFPILLYDVLIARKNIQNYFKQPQLWYLIYALISQTVGFDQNGLGKLGNIRPQNIFLNKYGHINIMCRLSTLSGNKPKVQHYYSPQFVKVYRKQRKDRKQIIKYQTFAIGLTCLDAALLQFSSKFYDSQNKQIDLQLLQEAREKLKKSNRYNNLLKDAILGLCNPNPQKRISCSLVYEMIKKYKNLIERCQLIMEPII